MADSIYRQEALERLASPDRLEVPLRLIGTAERFVVVGCVGLLVAAVLWASLSFAPVRIGGQGILIDRAGLAEVVAADAGRVIRLQVVPGQAVRRGQPIALLSRGELERELVDTEARLRQGRDRLADLERFQDNQRDTERSADGARIAGLDRSREELRRQLGFLDERARRVAELVPRGVVRRDAQIEAEAAAAAARERIADLSAQADRVRLEASRRDGENRLALLDARNLVADLERRRGALRARLTEQTVVRAEDDGRIVEIKAAVGDVLGAGAPLATLARDEAGGELIAVLYVPAGEGKRTQPGMAVELTPATVERAVFGHLRGTVASVAPLPATREGIRRTLRNDQLVEQLSAGGAVIEVRAVLQRDGKTPTGYAWSASQGPNGGVGAGTLTAAQVVVDRKRIVAWLLPGST